MDKKHPSYSYPHSYFVGQYLSTDRLSPKKVIHIWMWISLFVYVKAVSYLRGLTYMVTPIDIVGVDGESFHCVP